MKTFSEFLLLETEEKLKHLEHLEDHPINAGMKGFSHAVNTLFSVHHALTGRRSSPATISTKFDGSPSIVFGHHPVTNKFFVATKSAFNKDPKLNFSPTDIQKHHGHAPGLVSKVTHALKYLPKVTPKGKVFQGDLMYAKDDNDVKETPKQFKIKPNTITYSVGKGSPEGAKIKGAKIGVAVHTSYSGKSLEDMKAEFNADTSHFKDDRNVHKISTRLDTSKVHYPDHHQKEYVKHVQSAMKEHEKLGDYRHLEGHEGTVKLYINSTVRAGTNPNAAGYKKFMEDRAANDVAKYKTPQGQENRRKMYSAVLSHIDTHNASFDTMFKAHSHLQNAKNVLVRALETSKGDYSHSIGGKKTSPEGFVVSVKNRPTKFVNRQVFSAANLNKNK